MSFIITWKNPSMIHKNFTLGRDIWSFQYKSIKNWTYTYVYIFINIYTVYPHLYMDIYLSIHFYFSSCSLINYKGTHLHNPVILLCRVQTQVNWRPDNILIYNVCKTFLTGLFLFYDSQVFISHQFFFFIDQIKQTLSCGLLGTSSIFFVESSKQLLKWISTCFQP